ncbi:helix-turn-helix domain-containing protein [Sphingopyxis sp. JAI128]|uniref:helix-turn-helix domain-containing protein n=1 Tax=Sphingopyxis sp. JAI128 TaxID=2723066 RepID=UPI001614A2A6|nr:helix-turn-helix domain-containing protein [Sphingopyxis sp. JAI128]MBB6427981.1 transcriptional regulator with XRE-family HTH domain [Sphingopyxis sp. JAI128]
MAISGYFLPSASDADRRLDARRKLSLLARGAQRDGAGIDVQIHNISGTGLLFESDIKLAAGDRIEIELPHAGDITAKVIWASGRLFGCQFEGPVSPATLSAVELKSAIDAVSEIEEEPAAPFADDGFGARLQHFRIDAGLSQADVGKQMGVSAPSISSWENGRARPKHGRMAKLAAILGVEASDLVDDAPGEEIQDLVDRCREQIAEAVGLSIDRVRIFVEY